VSIKIWSIVQWILTHVSKTVTESDTVPMLLMVVYRYILVSWCSSLILCIYIAATSWNRYFHEKSSISRSGNSYSTLWEIRKYCTKWSRVHRLVTPIWHRVQHFFPKWSFVLILLLYLPHTFIISIIGYLINIRLFMTYILMQYKMLYMIQWISIYLFELQ